MQRLGRMQTLPFLLQSPCHSSPRSRATGLSCVDPAIRIIRLLQMPLLAAVMVMAGARAQAATLTFDADPLTAGLQEDGGPFQWVSGGEVFWNGSANVTAGLGDVAQFGNGGQLSSSAVISLSSQSLEGLRFEAVSGNGYSLVGLGVGQALTLGSSGLVVNAGAQAVNLGDASLSLVLGSAQTWTHKPGNGALLTVNGSVDNQGHLLTFTSDASSAVTLNGVMTGSGGLTKGAGLNEVSLTNVGNSFTGALTILQGTLTVASLADSGVGCNGTGAIHLGSGSTSGMLNYTGVGAVLTRAVDLAGTTGGAILSQSGTGVLQFLGDLTFAVSSTSAKTLTLQGSSAGRGEFAGVIRDNPGGGVTQVVKSGSGTWTLSGNNSYTGGTRIETGGTLNLNSASALGTSSLTFGGSATLDNTTGAPITLAAGNAILLNAGSLTFNGSNDLSFGSGVLMISGANRTVTTSAGTLTVGSVNANAASRTLTKSGAGTLVISGAAGADFQGGVTVSAGRLRLEHATAAGTGAITLSNTSAELEIGGSFAVANSLVIGAAGLTKTLSLGHGFSAIYAGSLTIQETHPGDFRVVVGAGDTLTLSGNISGVGQLVLQRRGAGDGGTVVLSGSNTHQGGTQVSEEMMLRLLSANALGAGSTVNLDGTGARLELGNGVNMDSSTPLIVGSFGGPKVLAMAPGTGSAVFGGDVSITDETVGDFSVFVSSGQALTLSGVISDTDSGGLAKQGEGLLLLAASNTYTGPTVVSSGALQVGSQGTGTTGTGDVLLQGGRLQGTGVILASTFVAAPGTSVHVGDSAAASDIGTLLFSPVLGSGSWDFQAGSSVFLGLAPGLPANADTMRFSGTGASVLNLLGELTVGPAAITPAGPETFQLLDWSGLAVQPVFAARFQSGSYGGLLAGNGDDNLGFNLPDVSGSGYLWDIHSFAVNGSIALVAVPEPSRIMMIMTALACLRLRRCRSE